MKYNPILKSTIATLMILGILMTTVKAFPIPNVTITVVDGTESYFLTTLSGVPVGEDISNGVYLGWCMDVDVSMPRDVSHVVTLYSSLSPPTELSGEAWDMVNYILNHKQGGRMDIQAALWYFVKMNPIGSPWGYYENPAYGYPPSAATQAMVADALANGAGFVPGPEDVLAIICVPTTLIQTSIIEYEIPPEGDQGLTPGFWKNHPELWAGFSTGQYFNDVFGVSITINAGKKDENSNPTLLEALAAKGGVNETKGVYDALARHAVAAILNAAHPNVYYPISISMIILEVQNAITNGDLTDAEPLKDQLEGYNMLGGGIDAHGNPV